jgi:phosphoribosyl 1,2-cyclic phosphodiesterase
VPLIVTSLASGSSGNVLFVRCSAGAILIDCGLPQRTLERALAHAELRPSDLSAILLTHEHGDHVGCAGPFARRHGLRVVANRATLAALRDDLRDCQTTELTTGGTQQIGPFTVRSFALPHDAADPVGFVVDHDGVRVAIATDLGSWGDSVAQALAEADLVVLEANHDRERLFRAPYAWPIKQRIASERGHLDNVDAGRLLAKIGADGRRRTAWLAHLSQEANSAEIALRVVRNLLSMARISSITVDALPRRAPLTWASDERGEQLRMF